MGLGQWLADLEERVRAHFNTDLSTPRNRRKANIYSLVFDHGFLRTLWTNFHQIAPGVYRSNHPTRARFEKMKAMGIRTVLTLRGDDPSAHFLLEQEICRDLGLNLVAARQYARAPARREDMLDLIAKLRTIEKPFVMHCKSGADRAGLASAIYLMVVEGQPVEKARRMLSPRYMHVRNGQVGILDHILDVYAARNAKAPISFEDWIAQDYDHVEMIEDFARSRGRR
ncbi:MAG: phosphatase domain-containing protein [Marinibacterium sp.]